MFFTKKNIEMDREIHCVKLDSLITKFRKSWQLVCLYEAKTLEIMLKARREVETWCNTVRTIHYCYLFTSKKYVACRRHLQQKKLIHISYNINKYFLIKNFFHPCYRSTRELLESKNLNETFLFIFVFVILNGFRNCSHQILEQILSHH